MKVKTSYFFAIFLLLPFMVFAQLNQDTQENSPTAAQYKLIKKYDAVVKLKTKEKIKGVVYKVTDEAVILLPKNKHIKLYSHFKNLTKKDQKIIMLPSISKVTTRKTGKIKNNFWKGAAIGAGIGLGLLGIEKASNGTGYFIYGLAPLTLAGGLLGTIISIPAKSHAPKEERALEALKEKGIMFGY